MLDLISVGIPSYNRPVLLKRAIQSVLSQTYKNLEIIISDNGSPDPKVRNIIEYFAKSDSRIRSVFHPVNKGSFFNFSSVLKEANGKYFIWLADDDYWGPEFVACLWEKAVQSGAALTYGRAEIVDIKIPEKDRFIKEMKTTSSSYMALANFIFLDTDTVFYGLYLTETGKRISLILSDWFLPKKIVSSYQFLEYNFVSYPFIFGLLATGGFCNASSNKTVHFVGGREELPNSTKLGWRHIRLSIAYLVIHFQMLLRFFYASFMGKSFFGVIFSPVAVLWLLIRRFSMIVSLRFFKSVKV